MTSWWCHRKKSERRIERTHAQVVAVLSPFEDVDEDVKAKCFFPFLSFFALQILHGSDQDILWLQRDLGLYVVNMFDTGQVYIYIYIYISRPILYCHASVMA